jgi:hypothetical protein
VCESKTGNILHFIEFKAPVLLFLSIISVIDAAICRAVLVARYYGRRLKYNIIGDSLQNVKLLGGFPEFLLTSFHFESFIGLMQFGDGFNVMSITFYARLRNCVTEPLLKPGQAIVGENFRRGVHMSACIGC